MKTNLQFSISNLQSICNVKMFQNLKINSLEHSLKIKNYKLKIVAVLFVCALFPTAASAASLTSGLVGYWTFDGKNLINNATDSSGQGNNGFLTNFTSTTTVVGKIGQALKFDGSNDLVNLGTPSSLNITGDITVGAWVYPKSGGSSGIGRIFDKDNATGAGYELSYSSDPTGYFFFSFINFQTTGPAVTLNAWQHIMVVSTGGRFLFYKNGVLTNNVAADGTLLATPAISAVIGNRANADRPWDGSIDDVRVYNRALSATEVTQLYKQGAAKLAVSPVTSLKTGLVGYWTFDGKNLINNVTDSSGQGNNGFLTNFTSTTTVVGKIGQALYFDGSDDYVVLPSAINTAITGNNVSVSVWVKASGSSFSQDTGIVDEAFLGDGKVKFAVVGNHDTGGSSTNIGAGFYNGSWHVVNESGSFTFGQWVHVVATYDGANIRLYLNGSLNNSTADTTALPSGTEEWRIGRRWDSATNFNGSLDDVRVYNRALSASEVTQLYKQGATKLGVSPSQGSGQQGLGAGLVGYWTFDGKDTNWNTNKTNDVSGNSNTGTMTLMSTTTSPVSGKIGQGLKFDGTSSYVSLGTFTNFGNSDRSASAWVYINAVQSGYKQIVAFPVDETVTDTPTAIIGTVTNTSNIYVGFGGFPYDGYVTLTTNTKKWYHVVLTISGNTVKGYLNGAFIGQATNSGAKATSPIGYIGRYNNYYGEYFNGTIDDVRIYNRALSASEVMQLYKQGASSSH